ncbi:MAG TPA: symmetrical bis(5'-nucleosyl)-tetraphosphatase [Casimicrobiaceae bacterium]|nr:symmetrical bis(5'-nucleosyl)-tetraphosphatase [Casimicrobiaceae bacterium]
MAHYAIGDIQGCRAELCELLALIGFSPATDRLWLTGDLVNRGPDSLGVLREVRALGSAAQTVLGNHDLHLLTVAAGHRLSHRDDTIAQILAAADRDELLEWLAHQPLAIAEDDMLMVHAGVLPQWSAARVLALAGEVETVLASADRESFLRVLYGDEPHAWRDDLEGFDRLRAIVNALTRLRFCTSDGRMEFREKRGAAHAPAGFAPWFLHEPRRSASSLVICGHWSTLGLVLAPNVLMLDSGCLWGGPLTAMRLSDRRVYQVPSHAPVTPVPRE